MLTGATSIMGTVDFMSPEQGFSSKNVDARTDIYSLGATMYFLLTKKVMYSGDSAFEKLLAHRELPIPSLCNLRSDVLPESLRDSPNRFVLVDDFGWEISFFHFKDSTDVYILAYRDGVRVRSILDAVRKTNKNVKFDIWIPVELAREYWLCLEKYSNFKRIK
jgi:serine/threonine protein kinase